MTDHMIILVNVTLLRNRVIRKVYEFLCIDTYVCIEMWINYSHLPASILSIGSTHS